MQSFYNNLKFNKTFQCELLHFTLTTDIITNNTELIALSEVIPNNKCLSSLILGIGNDITQQQQQFINKLWLFLQATSLHHKRIQSLTIISKASTALSRCIPLCTSLKLFIIDTPSNQVVIHY